MSVLVGYDPFNGNLCLYDIDRETTTYFEITKLYCEDLNNIEAVVIEIKSKIQNKVKKLCVMMDCTFQNTFRKCFLSTAEKLLSTNVKIISHQKAVLIGALTKMVEKPLTKSELLIFSYHEKFIFCTIWEYNENIGWKFRNYVSQTKTNLGWNNSPTLVDLQKLFEKIKNLYSQAVAFVYTKNGMINEDDFKIIFPNVTNVYCSKREYSFFSMKYAQFLIGDKNIKDYRMEEVLERSIEIKYNETPMILVPQWSNLPYKKSTILPQNISNKIKVSESQSITHEKIFCSAADVTLSLNIDIDGIFNVTLNYATICITNNSVAYLNSLFDEPIIFSATVSFNGQTPQVGVLDAPNSITNIIDILGQNISPKLKSFPMKRFYFQGYPELFFYFKDSETFVNPESAMAELLKEIVRRLGPSVDTYHLTIPRHFNKKQKQAYEKATQFAKLSKVYFVDEMIALAFGYKQKFELEEDVTFAIIQLSAFKFATGLFNSESINDKNAFSVVLDIGDIDYIRANFYDAIILNCENDDENKNDAEIEYSKMITNLTENGLIFLASIESESLHSIVIADEWIKDIINFYYAGEIIVKIDEYSSLAALGAQQCPILED